MPEINWERIVAVALLTREELDKLGASFDRAFPLEECDEFSDLLAAIDRADRERRQRQH